MQRKGEEAGAGSWGSGVDTRNVHLEESRKLPQAHGQETGHLPEELRSVPQGGPVAWLAVARKLFED